MECCGFCLGIVGRFHEWYIGEAVVITVGCLDCDTIAAVLAVPELFVDSGVVLNNRLIEVLARLMSVGEFLVGRGRNENLLKQEGLVWWVRSRIIQDCPLIWCAIFINARFDSTIQLAGTSNSPATDGVTH